MTIPYSISAGRNEARPSNELIIILVGRRQAGEDGSWYPCALNVTVYSVQSLYEVDGVSIFSKMRVKSHDVLSKMAYSDQELMPYRCSYSSC